MSDDNTLDLVEEDGGYVSPLVRDRTGRWTDPVTRPGQWSSAGGLRRIMRPGAESPDDDTEFRSATEYANSQRGPNPFPERWGPPPRNEAQRALWIRDNCQLEQRDAPARRAIHRLRELHLRRESP
ncbi:hypothetical protein ABZS66_37355 [Dactylosporangium sp. NPDC005572]|uniref:hypothetical protein n=1 Tax=Dactylosporangium sp. NPDC005572 TaxID=3156889 RepID=UPI0033B70E5E